MWEGEEVSQSEKGSENKEGNNDWKGNEEMGEIKERLEENKVGRIAKKERKKETTEKIWEELCRMKRKWEKNGRKEWRKSKNKNRRKAALEEKKPRMLKKGK